MRKTLTALLLSMVLATSLLCTGCDDSDEDYTDEVLALAGTEIDAVVTAYELEHEGTIEEELTINYRFTIELEDGDADVTTWGVWYTIEDEPDYDDVIDYADSEVDVTYEDGTEASVGDIDVSMSITVVQDEEGLPETIVIKDE